jgi:hypothetical protein
MPMSRVLRYDSFYKHPPGDFQLIATQERFLASARPPRNAADLQTYEETVSSLEEQLAKIADDPGDDPFIEL